MVNDLLRQLRGALDQAEFEAHAVSRVSADTDRRTALSNCRAHLLRGADLAEAAQAVIDRKQKDS